MTANRLQLPEWNIDEYKLIIFDADGTLRRCTVLGQPCPNDIDEWELIPGVKEKLATFDWKNKVYFGIASNQAGVALGYMRELQAYALLYDMACAALGGPAVTFRNIRMCPHAPDAECACRKPRGGMLISLMVEFGVIPHETLFVGDMDTDLWAADDAGCDFMCAHEFFKGYWDERAD